MKPVGQKYLVSFRVTKYSSTCLGIIKLQEYSSIVSYRIVLGTSLCVIASDIIDTTVLSHASAHPTSRRNSLLDRQRRKA